MRNIKFIQDEYYHIYNRGVDKRSIFEEFDDLQRFLNSMREFNAVEPMGGLYRSSIKKEKNPTPKLVRFIAYCLNQNHFHFILEPLVENGIQQFMHRLSTGYTNYFNEKYKRTGALFQGTYKATHIETNEYLLHVSIYVNLNDCVHKDRNKSWFSKLPFSSFKEYSSDEIKQPLCDTHIVLSQFSSKKAYVQHAKSVLPHILIRKENEKRLHTILLECEA